LREAGIRKRPALPPHIGTLSLSPGTDSINLLTPDNRGGNMDVPDMGPGSINTLPVLSPGARLWSTPAARPFMWS
jgi:acetamidase/formamidase